MTDTSSTARRSPLPHWGRLMRISSESLNAVSHKISYSNLFVYFYTIKVNFVCLGLQNNIFNKPSPAGEGGAVRRRMRCQNIFYPLNYNLADKMKAERATRHALLIIKVVKARILRTALFFLPGDFRKTPSGTPPRRSFRLP